MQGVLLAAIVAAGVALSACTPARAVTSFDGIADQHFGDSGGPWQHPEANNAGTGIQLGDLFTQTWVGSGRIKYARMVTAWNAVAQGGTCLDTAKRFYNYALAHGLTPVVSVWNSWAPGCANSSPPTTAGDYSLAMSDLINALYSGSSPNTAPTIIEAWNEPNFTLSTNAALAAQFWVKANDLCHGSCTTIAGDFTDSHDTPTSGCTSGYANVKSYEQSYLSYFSSNGIAAPTQWGFHPYNSGLCRTATPVNDLNSVLSGVAGHALWYTEAGAYVCQPSSGTYQDASQQQADAAYLNSLLGSSYGVAHAFYYNLASGSTAPINAPNTCPQGSSGNQDSVLYGGDPNDGQYHERPAARTIYGPSSLSASSQAADGIGMTAATLHGTVTPGGVADASAYFQYGASTSYGSSTATVAAGPGLSAIAQSASVAGLSAGATYHYRMVATNEDGQTAYGPDQTVTTLADTDADGIADVNDQCPNEKGVTAGAGCPVDDQPAAVAGINGSGSSTFARASDHSIHVSTWTGSSQSRWSTLGGNFLSGPAATRWNDGRVAVVAMTADGTYLEKIIDENGRESSWTSIGSGFVSSPAVMTRRNSSNAPGTIMDVAGRKADGAIWFRSYDTSTGQWQGDWYSLGGSLTSAPGLTSWYAGSIEVLARGTDNAIWRRYYNGSTWSGWESLGGTAGSSPAATSWYSRNLDVSYRGTDGNIYYKDWDGPSGTWSGWKQLAANVDSAPAAISEYSGQLAFFARSGSQIVQRKYENGAWWSTWTNVGDLTATNPSAVDDEPAAVPGYNGSGASTFARDVDGTVRMTTAASGGQTRWQSLGGSTNAGPAAALRADGTIDVVILWDDGSYRHMTIGPDGTKSGWTTIGTGFDSAPAAMIRRGVNGPGPILDVAGRKPDGAIWFRSYDTSTGQWQGDWYSLGGSLTSNPALTTWYQGSIEVLARGTDNAIWRKYYNGSAWSGWVSLGGDARSGPSATSWYSGNLNVSYRGGDGNVYYDDWNDANHAWSGWTQLSASIDTAPAEISETSGELTFLGRSGTQIVERKYENNAWWADWSSLGNPSLRISQP